MKVDKYVCIEEVKEDLEHPVRYDEEEESRPLYLSIIPHDMIVVKNEQGEEETIYGTFITVKLRERPRGLTFYICLSLPDVEEVTFSEFAQGYENILKLGINAVINSWYRNRVKHKVDFYDEEVVVLDRPLDEIAKDNAELRKKTMKEANEKYGHLWTTVDELKEWLDKQNDQALKELADHVEEAHKEMRKRARD